MNLIEMLPNLKGWRFDIRFPTAFALPAGRFRTVFDSSEIKKPMMGYMFGQGIVSDNPLLQAQVSYYGPEAQERSASITSFALNAAGLVGYWNPLGYASIYNAVLGIYSIAYQPVNPAFFSDGLRLRLFNGTAATINVASYSHSIVLIMDDKAWRKSLRKVFQSEVFHVVYPDEKKE